MQNAFALRKNLSHIYEPRQTLTHTENFLCTFTNFYFLIRVLLLFYFVLFRSFLAFGLIHSICSLSTDLCCVSIVHIQIAKTGQYLCFFFFLWLHIYTSQFVLLMSKLTKSAHHICACTHTNSDTKPISKVKQRFLFSQSHCKKSKIKITSTD